MSWFFGAPQTIRKYSQFYAQKFLFLWTHATLYYFQVDAVDKNGLVLPVSMWIKRLELDREPRCLVVMEPVERTVATVKFDCNVSMCRRN